MRIRIFACRIFGRELSYCASRSPNVVDVTWLPQGLHDTPELLHRRLESELDRLYADMADRALRCPRPDYIGLCYGLCSNGVVGLTARDIPIVVPRCDDCTALFLGSQKRYMELFECMKGTMWLNNGWLETSESEMLGGSLEEKYREKYQEYVELYGEDNAQFLLDFETNWKQNYSYGAYISSSVYNNPEYEQAARRAAEQNGWQYRALEGDSRLIRALCDGTWTEEEFLVCPPGHRIEADAMGGKVKAVKIE